MRGTGHSLPPDDEDYRSAWTTASRAARRLRADARLRRTSIPRSPPRSPAAASSPSSARTSRRRSGLRASAGDHHRAVVRRRTDVVERADRRNSRRSSTRTFAAEAAGAPSTQPRRAAARAARGALGSKMRQFMQRYDLLVTPSVAVPAVRRAASRARPDDARLMLGWTPFSYPFNLTQQPACTVPVRPHERRAADRPADRRPDVRRRAGAARRPRLRRRATDREAESRRAALALMQGRPAQKTHRSDARQFEPVLAARIGACRTREGAALPR